MNFTRQQRTTTLAIALGLLTVAYGGHVVAADTAGSAAQPPVAEAAGDGDRRSRWAAMSDEERAARRAEHKAHWAAMSDEERAAWRAERKARWEAMTDEERAAKRASHKARWEALSDEERAAHKARWHGKGGKHRMYAPE